MSWSLRASLLIALESKRGAWCTLPWLAEHVVAGLDAVALHAGELAGAGLVQYQRGVGGTWVVGVEVTEEFPLTYDVMGPLP